MDDYDEIGKMKWQDEAEIRREFSHKYEFLRVGDVYKIGDRYGVGFCFYVGSTQTKVKPGDSVRKEEMRYLPRRPRQHEKYDVVGHLTLKNIDSVLEIYDKDKLIASVKNDENPHYAIRRILKIIGQKDEFDRLPKWKKELVKSILLAPHTDMDYLNEPG